MFSEQRVKMMDYATAQARKLKQLHRYYPKDRRYPRDSRYESAIYDLENQKIFSTLKENSVRLNEVICNIGASIHLVKILDDYYLGAKYLIVEVSKDQQWYRETIGQILIYASATLVLLMLLGLYLARLFVLPMKNSILLMDRFIKDTTHELNTPLAAMLANLEMMDREKIDQDNAKKLNRIEIGARTISTLYEDLKFLTLENSKNLSNDSFDMTPLLESRLEYFSLQMQSKKIRLKKRLSSSIIYADKKLITRVLDNLISNAIKYNKRSGVITILLEKGAFIIEDTGIGIADDKLDDVFDRYSRFNDSEGGFGIGLNIVKDIVDYYKIEIEITSKLNVGTIVALKWKDENYV